MSYLTFNLLYTSPTNFINRHTRARALLVSTWFLFLVSFFRIWHVSFLSTAPHFDMAVKLEKLLHTRARARAHYETRWTYLRILCYPVCDCVLIHVCIPFDTWSDNTCSFSTGNHQRKVSERRGRNLKKQNTVTITPVDNVENVGLSRFLLFLTSYCFSPISWNIKDLININTEISKTFHIKE